MTNYSTESLTVKQANEHCEVRQSPIHGRGVFASQDISEGTRIIQYVGEKIDKEESNRRGLELFEESQKTGGAAVYIFDLNEEWDLDGNSEDNDARLINHSCEPNSEMVNEEDELWLYALQDIAKGEEISFDYGYDLEHFLDHPCRCGTDSCVGFIVSQSQWKKLKKRLRKMKKKSKGSVK
jgi:SET domain-containing protein